MVTAMGHNSRAGFGVEAEYGTAVARTLGVRLSSEGDNITRKAGTKAHQLYGALSNRARVKQRYSTEGSVKWDITREGVGPLRLLEALFGKRVTAAAAEVGYFDHTLTLDKVVPSLCWESNRDAETVGKALLYTGLKASKGTISAKANEPVACSLDVLGDGKQVELEAPSVAPALPSADFWTLDEAVLTFGEGEDAEDVYLDSFELGIDRKPDADFYQGRYRADVIAKDPIAVTFKIETVLNLETYNQIVSRLIDEEFTSAVLTLTNEADANEKIVITLPRLSIEGEYPVAKGPGKISFTPSFTAYSGADVDLQEVGMVVTNKTNVA